MLGLALNSASTRLNEDRILVTGAAGFIGSHVAAALLDRGYSVVGVDSLNDYYAVELKLARVERLARHAGFNFRRVDLSCIDETARIFSGSQFRYVIHLAAQAGVRYSIENPAAYVQSNLVGFANVLECCRGAEVAHLLYASSSSVYGENSTAPFSVQEPADRPVSFYAATKRANELMAHSYSGLFGLPTTGLRFFTVYGPWGRPDMAYWTFTNSVLNGRSIRLFNKGRMFRDFTYIDDVVESIIRLLPLPPLLSGVPGEDRQSGIPWRVLNVGNSHPIALGDFISILESATGRTAKREYVPMQPGDVTTTSADVTELENLIGVIQHTPIEIGLPRFVEWYREFIEKSEVSNGR